MKNIPIAIAVIVFGILINRSIHATPGTYSPPEIPNVVTPSNRAEIAKPAVESYRPKVNLETINGEEIAKLKDRVSQLEERYKTSHRYSAESNGSTGGQSYTASTYRQPEYRPVETAQYTTVCENGVCYRVPRQQAQQPRTLRIFRAR